MSPIGEESIAEGAMFAGMRRRGVGLKGGDGQDVSVLES